jgi:hypothetical protein
VARRTTCAAVLLVLAAGCGGAATSDESGAPEDFVLKLFDQSSGESGTATLTPLGNRTKVTLEIERSASPVSRPRPAHIHKGSCAKLDPTPAYGLGNVQDGTSTTTVSASIPDLRYGSFAIDVHESAAQRETYVACGNLPDARPRIVDPIGHDRIDE